MFKSGLLRAFADNHVIAATLEEGAVDDGAKPHVQIVIDVRRMHVLDPGLSAKDRQAVQMRMLGPEVLDSERFQRITFHSIAVERLGPDSWLVRGELELHGQIHGVPIKVALDQGHYKGSTTLRQTEFGITPISIVGGTVKVKDEITVDFDIVMK